MTSNIDLQTENFWDPEFVIEHRDDGAIIMAQKDDLPDYLPTIADYLDKWADATPDQTWIARRVNGANWRRINYSDARSYARSIGGALLQLGLGPDRPLMILSENSLEHALLGIACAYVGIPYAPISPAYSLLSADYVKLKKLTETLSPGAVFADDGTAFESALTATFSKKVVLINKRNLVTAAMSFDSLLDVEPKLGSAARNNVTGDTVVKYLFTSGSTGAPKAVINTNTMICAMQAMTRDCYRYVAKHPPVVVDWAPWHHTAAGNKVTYMVLTNGGSYYIDDGRPTPDKFDETLRNLRDIACTWYFNVPIGWDLLVDALEKEPDLAHHFFSQLGMMFYAGAGMAQHTWDRLRAVGREAAGHEVLLATGLGSTETAPFALACTDVQEKSGNVGVPSRGMIMKLVPNNGKMEVRLKGPNIAPGYLNDREKTAEMFDEEGFYQMGDALRPADPNNFAKGFFFDGRIAENFKLTTGTWVAVGAVRTALVDAMGGLIRDAVITGESEAELGALLLLSDNGRAMEKDALKQALTAHLVTAGTRTTGSASRVKRVLVLSESPSLDRGEVTDKGSLNQRAMRANHAKLIAKLYAGGESVICAD